MGCCFKVSFGAMMKPIHHEYTPLLASECDEEENETATRWEEISCEELIEQHADDYEDEEDEDEDEDDEPEACDACTEGKMAPCSFKKGKLVPTKACKKCIESQCNEPEKDEDDESMSEDNVYRLCKKFNCIGQGGCLLIDDIGSYTCELDADHFKNEKVCHKDDGHWCEPFAF